MIHRIHSIAGVLGIVALTFIGAAAAKADDLRGEIEAIVRDYLAQHPEDVQRIVKDYLVRNPAVLQEAIGEMLKKRQPAANVDRGQQIKQNEALLFSSPRQVTLGSADGDITVVEFFDYNCGYCKRALPDMLTLLKEDPRLKFVLKEFPILGPGSADAARVAVAARMQDPEGQRYLAFHQRLLGERQANKETALAAAKDAGFDIARIDTDMAGDEVTKTLQESVTLARALGINGTPGYVIGDTVVPGAVGAAALKEKIQSARSRRPM